MEPRDAIEAASSITDKRCLTSLSVNCPPLEFAEIVVSLFSDFRVQIMHVLQAVLCANNVLLATILCTNYVCI